jgi:hypothetical protein
MDMLVIHCPSCGEAFEVACPSLEELPAELDYDCEVCCQPMLISVYETEGEVAGEARSLDE